MTAQASLFGPLDVAITDPGEVDIVGGKVEYHPTREREVVEALILGMREAREADIAAGKAFPGHEPLPFHGIVREAAAGEGALVEHVEALWPSTTRRWHLHELKASLATVCRVRLAPMGLRTGDYQVPIGGPANSRVAVRVGDFLAAASSGLVALADLAITNPGFSRAIEWAAAELQTATHVALHLPLATLETPDRCAWLRAHMPDVYPLEWRPDYDGRGGFNRPVCWLVWGPGRGGRWWPLRHPRRA